MTLAEALMSLYPGANPNRDFRVDDNGAGPFIAYWDEAKLGPRPTQAQIDAAPPLAPPDPFGTWNVITLKIAFNHENRIRALEGKQAVTIAQFKTAVRAML